MKQQDLSEKNQLEETKELTTQAKRLHKFYAEISPLLKTSEAKNLGLLALSFVLTGIFIFFAVAPVAGEILFLKKTLSEQKEVLQKQKDKIALFSRLEQEFSSKQGKLPLLKLALPTKPAIENFIVLAEKTASQSGLLQEAVQFQNLRLAQTETNSPDADYSLAEVNFVQTISGNYQNLKNYLQSLSHFLRPVQVKEVVFKAEEETVRLEIQGKIFFLRRNL